ncbi:unnamed protein product [Prorocentrum cordatum]|uniref:Uncharacterized protein n=1 Tax=Prorocentrum cordatum TaxID=2364126 RepID=A0ABN9WDJ2_9DINO|nr:unnamed protein product [Polarella glacialis]
MPYVTPPYVAAWRGQQFGIPLLNQAVGQRARRRRRRRRPSLRFGLRVGLRLGLGGRCLVDNPLCPSGLLEFATLRNRVAEFALLLFELLPVSFVEAREGLVELEKLIDAGIGSTFQAQSFTEHLQGSGLVTLHFLHDHQ